VLIIEASVVGRHGVVTDQEYSSRVYIYYLDDTRTTSICGLTTDEVKRINVRNRSIGNPTGQCYVIAYFFQLLDVSGVLEVSRTGTIRQRGKSNDTLKLRYITIGDDVVVGVFDNGGYLLCLYAIIDGVDSL
jgi:hypothetical protein